MLQPFTAKSSNLIPKNYAKDAFECPICSYYGQFMHVKVASDRIIKHMRCPNCSSNVHHRLQYLVFMDILKTRDVSKMKMLHVAPEPFFRPIFSKYFKIYKTADLEMRNVDYQVDLTSLPFEDKSYDFVFASHVLEHIRDDEAAATEVSRILRPGGLALLPVPIACDKTVEYPEPNPYEYNHVRASGPEYFERFKPFFKDIKLASSDSYPQKYQLYYYTDRTQFPNEKSPYRTPMAGEKHFDMVPICHA